MFLRRCIRKKNGKPHSYWALVESYRTARGSRQRLVAYVGELRQSARLPAGLYRSGGDRRRDAAGP